MYVAVLVSIIDRGLLGSDTTMLHATTACVAARVNVVGNTELEPNMPGAVSSS